VRYLIAPNSCVLLDTSKSSSPDLSSNLHGAIGASIDLAKIVDKTVINKWQPVSIDLGCYADKGVNFASLTSPFSLHSNAKASVSVANIQFVPNKAKGATLSCK